MKQKIKRVNYFINKQTQIKFPAQGQNLSNSIRQKKRQISLEQFDSYSSRQQQYQNSFMVNKQQDYRTLKSSKQSKTNFEALLCNLQLICPCCMQSYDLQSRNPLAICIEQYSICKMCYQNGSFFVKSAENFECYICKLKTNKLSVRPHRILRNIIENFPLLNQLESKDNCKDIKSSINQSAQIKKQIIRRRQHKKEHNRGKSLSEIRKTIPCKFQLRCRYFKKGICRYFHEERRLLNNDYTTNRKYYHSLPKKNQNKFY